MDTNQLPGKLGNPDISFIKDERLDPRLAAAFEMLGGYADDVPTIGTGASYEEALEYCLAFETSAAQSHPMLFEAMPDFPAVNSRTQVISGIDGNDISLYISAPKDLQSPAPCIFHSHGGGMAIMTAADPGFVRWRHDLASQGLVVISVEFRNAGGSLGNHPFPAGLNDCESALKWVNANRAELGISKIIMSGESGGGNLAIANTLKAKQDGYLDMIDGVYAMCPYISGCYADPLPNLISLEENDGYTIGCDVMSAMVKAYDPKSEHGTNPLAWPYHASNEELEGLPPFIISVNELDPLRDEGLVFTRKLKAAGNSAIARTVHGTTHAGDISMPDVTPDIYQETVRSLVGFANAL